MPVATTAVRNLGARFDCNLSMSTHINKICQSVYYHLHNIRQIWKCLTYDSIKLLVQAVMFIWLAIITVMAYCIGYQQCICQSYRAFRTLSHTWLHIHLDFTIFCLFFLPLITCSCLLSIDWISYKIATLTFKVICFSIPAYLHINLIQIRHNDRYLLPSIHLGILLQDPSVRFKCTLGDRAFSASAPQTWNALPANIRSQTNFNIFKTMLKTYYFKKAFSNNML